MIQQHFLQQQRLNYNHDRLLDRYHRLLPPKITEFRTFGASVLPGRNYEKHLDQIHGHGRRRSSLVEQSRAGIGRSNETYRSMGEGASEILPRNISSVVQHSRSQSVPLVHAEKFEPVQFYDHPMYGPTPAYIRPVFNNQEFNDNNSEKAESDDDDDDVRSHVSIDRVSTPEHHDEKKNQPVKDQDDSKKGPLGYISYKRWKAKYANLIPVDPLLFNIYTKRPNGSIHKYGQSLYSSPSRHRPANLDEDLFTPTTSEVESVRSETPQETSLPSYRRYNHLKQQRSSSALIPRPLEPIQTENESSDNETSPPDSPVPYLSRNRPNPFSSAPLSTTIPPAIARPSTPPPPLVDTFVSSTLDATPTPLASSAPSNIPPAPPLPPSLAATTSSSNRYETPSSLPINSPPSAPPMPASLAVSNSTATYQAPSTSSNLGPGTKAVSFVGASSTPAGDNDASSSSDSEDEEKQKRRRRQKRQAAGGNADSSSSDD